VAGIFSRCGETAAATYEGDLKFDSGGARTKSPTGLSVGLSVCVRAVHGKRLELPTPDDVRRTRTLSHDLGVY